MKMHNDYILSLWRELHRRLFVLQVFFCFQKHSFVKLQEKGAQTVIFLLNPCEYDARRTGKAQTRRMHRR